MTEDHRDGRMRHVGAVAALLVLKALARAQIESRSVVTPNGVAGAGKTWADTQGGNMPGRKALDVEGTPNRSEGSNPAAGTRPARGHM